MELLADAIAESVAENTEDGSLTLRQVVTQLKLPSFFLAGFDDGVLLEEVKEYPALVMRGFRSFGW